MEIERKWLFNNLPEHLESFSIKEYKQGYLNINPEFRIRSKRCINPDISETTYKLCIKSKGTIERYEVEKPLSEKEFKELMVIGNINKDGFITKLGYNYDLDGYILGICIVDDGTPNMFMYGEIEFATVNEANGFEVPEWFGKEITYDPKYKMCNYWIRTRLGNDMKFME